MLKKILQIKKVLLSLQWIKKQTDMKKVIYTTDIDNYKYEDYLEYCESNEIEPQDEDSNDYWDWVSDMISLDIEDAYSNIDCNQDANTMVVITGTLGLWYGNPEIDPVFVESESEYHHTTKQRSYSSALSLAIKKCAEGMDDVECYLDDETGCVEVIGHHHDGTNRFCIRKLSEFGKSAKDDAEYEDNYNMTDEWFEKFTEDDLY